MGEMDIIEINEAFAVQALYCLDRLGLRADDPRVNIWGGSLAFGHPWPHQARGWSPSDEPFKENADARYGLTTMCVGRGQVFHYMENVRRS